MAINSKVDIDQMWLPLSVNTPGGSQTVSIRLHELHQYNDDPDAFVAQYFGMSLAQYVEWVELDGAPLCGANTRAGKPCKSMIGRIQMGAEQWLATHREGYCKAHGG